MGVFFLSNLDTHELTIDCTLGIREQDHGNVVRAVAFSTSSAIGERGYIKNES